MPGFGAIYLDICPKHAIVSSKDIVLEDSHETHQVFSHGKPHKGNEGNYKGSIELTIGKTWTITAEALAPSKNAYVRAEQPIEVSSNASPGISYFFCWG